MSAKKVYMNFILYLLTFFIYKLYIKNLCITPKMLDFRYFSKSQKKSVCESKINIANKK